MAVLLVVDLQREFVKDDYGLKVYKRDIEFIKVCAVQYSEVIAGVYKNDSNRNMSLMVRWEEMQKIKKLDFKPDRMAVHSGYTCGDKLDIPDTTRIDVIGLDTDACVLSTCFDLFNRGKNFKILLDGCWSSGGESMHEHGLACMRRQFNRAVDDATKLEKLVESQRILAQGIGGRSIC